MRLNPDKCAFKTEGGKLLGFMLRNREIEANLEKCKEITEMRSLMDTKEIQKLIRQLTVM